MKSNALIRACQSLTGKLRLAKLCSASALVFLAVACSTPGPSLAQDSASGSSAATSTTDYKISPEDILTISVWREPELQREVVVRPDGGVSFPLIGDVEAAGITAKQLAENIQTSIAEYVPEAVVNVSVKEIRGLKIFVTGQVKRPGQYQVGRYVDVLQAITLAGGLTPFANQRQIKILRRGNDSEKVFTFDYVKVQRGQALEQNILLLPGDSVIVP